jgi:CBS domain-containing protein
MLRGVKVGQVMTAPREVVNPNLTIGQLINQYFIYRGEQVLPVVDNNRLVGLIGPNNVRQVPPPEWENVTVGQLMWPRQSLPVAQPNDDLQTTLETLGQRENAPFILPVLDNNEQLVGVVTPFELMRFLQFRRQYGGVPSAVPINPPGQPLNPNYPPNDRGSGAAPLPQ